MKNNNLHNANYFLNSLIIAFNVHLCKGIVDAKHKLIKKRLEKTAGRSGQLRNFFLFSRKIHFRFIIVFHFSHFSGDHYGCPTNLKPIDDNLYMAV